MKYLLMPCKSPWFTPFGFDTYKMPKPYIGVMHVYDDGELKVTVKPVFTGYSMQVDDQEPKQFSNVHAALAAGAAVLRELPRYRKALSEHYSAHYARRGFV